MPSSLVVPLCRKSILVAVQSKIINLNANKGKGGAGARGHSNIHTYCYIETSSSLPQPSHLHLLFWTEDIIQGFYSIRTLGRCACNPCRYYSLYEYIRVGYHPHGPIFRANDQRTFSVSLAPPCSPGQDFKLLHRQSVGWNLEVR